MLFVWPLFAPSPCCCCCCWLYTICIKLKTNLF
uniref:GG16512 n=1 Tax=Drosophila erecta TaxID=7220 RepID=B3P409_DROER